MRIRDNRQDANADVIAQHKEVAAFGDFWNGPFQVAGHQ